MLKNSNLCILMDRVCNIRAIAYFRATSGGWGILVVVTKLRPRARTPVLCLPFIHFLFDHFIMNSDFTGNTCSDGFSFLVQGHIKHHLGAGLGTIRGNNWFRHFSALAHSFSAIGTLVVMGLYRSPQQCLRPLGRTHMWC